MILSRGIRGVCVRACMYVCTHVCLQACVLTVHMLWQACVYTCLYVQAETKYEHKASSPVTSHLLFETESPVNHLVEQLMRRFQGSASLCPPALGLQGCAAIPAFFMDAGDLNSRHQANTAGTLLNDHLPRLTWALLRLLLVLLHGQRVARE